jgi:hypothetical protein
MKLSILKSTLALAMSGSLTVQAGVYNYGGSAYDLPDGSLGGVSKQIMVSGAASSLTEISVAINVSGGYNGDLYAYLSYNGALVPLLNRAGVGSSPSTTSAFGYANSGLHLVLSDSGANGDIHLYQQVSGYASLIADGTSTWTPDGRKIKPSSSSQVDFDTAASSRLGFDATFGGMNPNGTWTLFFADVSAGGGQAVVNGWSLDITAVPEPVNVALGLFGVVFAGVTAARWRLNRKSGSA